jgi:hypothetical protein
MDTDDPMATDRMAYEGGEGGEGGESRLSADVEHEVALRLIASRAITDDAFYRQLRNNPRAAAAKLHIHLGDADVERLRRIDWNSVDQHVAELRRELGVDAQLRAAW